MNTETNNKLNFLTLHALLREVMAFAVNNSYQTPEPVPEQLSEFEQAMQELFMLSEHINLLPDSSPGEHLERVACLYLTTQHGLFDLLYICPAAADTKHWFDFQEEYNVRKKQTEDLSQLIIWHQQFYKNVLTLFPNLPIPFPDGSASVSDTTTPEAAQLTTDERQISHDPLPDVIV
ncbi:hypothetical protein QE250_12255 [Chromatiaceae bacterium AAb-1]|jgi:hypothetical protein|nr:hypothetical protein [Chromatiaceae bacterium AAb-1]